MYVQPLHALAADRDAAVACERDVALLLDDRLRLGTRERVGCPGGDREPFGLCGPHRRAPQHHQRVGGLGHGLADVRVRLEHRGEELGLQPPGQLETFDAAQQPVDRCDLLEGRGVDDHQLFFDTERKRRALAEVNFDHAVLTPCTGRPAATHA